MSLTASERTHLCIGLGLTRDFVLYRDRLSSQSDQTLRTGSRSPARATVPSRCGNNRAEKGVCTLCTPWVSDWGGSVPVWGGLGRFSGEASVCKG